MGQPLVVTGGIASGKSTVGRFLRDLGWRVLDADAVAAEVFDSAEVQQWLKGELGEVADLRGAARLRLADPGFRKQLNAQMHPRVYRSLTGFDGEAVEIPLLVESGLVSAFGPVLVCDCPIAVARERLATRLGDVAQAEKLIKTQVSPGARRIFGDWVIRTDQALDSVRDMVQTVAKSVR